MTVRIGLLRAVNVGGVQLSMEGLRTTLERMGLEKVQTLIQSGNFVFRGPPGAEDELERKVEARIARDLRVATDVFLRTTAEWAEAMARNPFRKEAKEDPSRLVVVALKEAPAPEQWDDLGRAIPGRERVRGIGRQAYAYYPDGQGRSKFTIALIEKRLGTRGTARNWNTVTKLAALADAIEKPDSGGP